jgi:hypothetical protein
MPPSRRTTSGSPNSNEIASDTFTVYYKDHSLTKQAAVQDARSELKAEIERSKTLASNPSRKTPAFPQGRSQGTILGNDNPKNTEVIKLYEDLTNLLVPVLRFSTGNYFHLSEANFTCIYTFVPRSEDEGKAKSKTSNRTSP